MSEEYGHPQNLDEMEQPVPIGEDVITAEKADSNAAITIAKHGTPATLQDGKDSEDEKVIRDESQHSTEEDVGDDHEDEEEQRERAELEALERFSTRTPVHSIFSKSKKRFIVFMTAWGGLFSPMAANIYFAALNPLSRALGVSDSLINLSLTSYMIFQGLAPSFFGDLSDNGGRRPAFIISLSIFLIADIGLALQTSYPALIVLRCVQSMGSSATIALAQGIVADIATSAERGSYVGYVQTPMTLGQSIGPAIGGILSQFLGWRSIFWFLAIFVVSFLIPYIILVPETSRKVVGNGSIPPQGWNMSLLAYLEHRRLEKEEVAQSGDADTTLSRATSRQQQQLAREALAKNRKIGWPNPFHAVQIVAIKENAAVLFYNSIVFVAFIDTVASVPMLFTNNYGFDDLKIGLCYIPFGAGSATSTFVNGKMLDWNYRRIARKIGFPVDKRRQADLRNYPLEKARLQVAIPLLWIGSLILCVYGWLLEKKVHFAGPLVLIFFIGYCITGCFNVLATLLVDLNLDSPATATAANNLVRCLFGAGAAALIVPMINGIGEGWAFTLHTFILLASSPAMFFIIKWGPGWREEVRLKKERAAKVESAPSTTLQTIPSEEIVETVGSREGDGTDKTASTVR